MLLVTSNNGKLIIQLEWPYCSGYLAPMASKHCTIRKEFNRKCYDVVKVIPYIFGEHQVHNVVQIGRHLVWQMM